MVLRRDLRFMIATCLLLTGCGLSSGPPPAVSPSPSLSPTAIPTTQLFPTPTPESTLTPTFQPSATPSPSPSSTPMQVLRQLTTGGCCVQPFWSPDSRRVLYLDKPDEHSPAAFYGVGLDGGSPTVVLERLGVYSPGLQYVAYPQSGQTIVERLQDGQKFTVPSEGRAVSFSPDDRWIAWTTGQSGPPFDTARREIWVSAIDGSQPHRVANVYAGGLSGWFPDGRLLLSGKLSLDEKDYGFFSLSPEGGDPVEIARAGRLRSASLSPDGVWLAYVVAFADDAAQDGLWMVNVQTHAQSRLPRFGAFHWRDGSRLLLIPLDLNLPVHQLWQYDAPSESLVPITDPAVTPFKVANNDWTVSPDGRHVAFVSAEDGNIWLLDLP